MKKFLSVLLSASLMHTAVPSFGLHAFAADAAQTTSIKIVGLQTDHLTNPIGIDSETPLFSWKLEAPDTRGQKQTAYRVTVAASADKLQSGESVWDSAFVASDETLDIPYAGAALEPSTRYYWQVEIKDKDGKSVLSEPAFFETGLMASGWSGAKWIARSEPKSDGYFRLTSFSLDFDYTIVNSAASILFGGKSDGDFYMWQISAFSWHNDLRLRPHICQSGGFSEISGVTFESDKTNAYKKHHMTIECKEGVVKTYHDGTLKDTRTLSGLELGYIGFRCASPESFTADNIVVKDGDGNILLNADFDDDNLNGFTGIPIVDGVLSLDSSKLSSSIILRKSTGVVKAESAPMFRKDFTVDANKTVKSARLYATAAGTYDAYINGKRVTDSVLNPGMTAYDDHMLYQTFDVTDLVKSGANAIGVYLGHGWFNRALRGFGSTLAFYGKLAVFYTDGTSDVIVSDDSWSFYRYGPILDDDIFNGFKYDALIEKSLDGWNEPGFDDSSWDAPAILAANRIVSNGQTPEIIAQNIPLIRPTIELPALSVTEPEEGVYVYDFGQNIAGVVRVTASAPAGTVLKLRHAEILNREKMTGATGEPGTIYTGNLPRAEATDTYTFRGDKGEETFEPFFTYHGFRYLEITGLDEPLPLEKVTALLLMSDLEQTSEFDSSNALVNRLYLNSLWSARDNFISVPTDCPQRGERFGWTGDAQIFARTGSYLMDVNAFYQKYCMDMRDTSTNNRIIADVSPASVGPGWYGQGNRKGATNGWGDAIIIIPYQMYMQYGNKAVLTENYETMCNWMDYLVSTSENYIRDESWTGDWLPVGEPKSPIALTDTAFCAYSASLLAEISAVLGKPDKADEYRALYENYRTAWRAKFLTGGEGGKTICGTQTSYVLGIKFGLFDEDEMAEAAENLAKNIKSRGWHLTTGFLGLSYLNPVLSDAGYSDVAYKLLEQEEYPSWLYSVTTGSTTIWESWYAFRTYADGSSAANGESYNHFSYGAVSEWLFRYVLGIERDENAVAYKHIILKPEFGGSFTHAGGSYNSVRGKIESGWTLDKESGAFTYHAVVPANTTATLYLPAENAESTVTESGKPVSESEGVTFVSYKDGAMVYELESGTYDFAVTVDPKANDITSVKLTNVQKIPASVTADGKIYTAFPTTFLSSQKSVVLNITTDDEAYAFLRFTGEDGKTYENGEAVSGDNNLNLVFAYTGKDDGTDSKKTVTLTGKSGVKIAVNGEETALPYTGSFDKGAEVKIEVLSVPDGFEFDAIGDARGIGSTVYLKPLADFTAEVKIKNELYRKGYDVFFGFDENVDYWKGVNAAITWEEGGYMRFKAAQKSDGSFDPRAGYNFTESKSTITGGDYVPASKYESLTIGYIADSVAGDSRPVMYIATEDQPSYINPVRERGATSKILASYADGKTLREVTYSLNDWSAWTGNIKEIYLDILDNVDGDLRVDYILLKRGPIKLTIKTEGLSDAVYTYKGGETVDLSALAEADKEGFLGFTLENGSTDYVTSVTMTDDITLYANYKEVVLPVTVFDFEDNTKQGWNVMNGGASSVTDGVYKVAFDTQKADAWLYNANLSLDANTLRYVVVKMRHNIPQGATGSKKLEVFFVRTVDTPWQPHLCASTTQQPASDEFVTYVIDMKNCSYWNGTVNRLRIDPFEVTSPTEGTYTFEVEEIAVTAPATLILDGGYDGAKKQMLTIPAYVPYDLTALEAPTRTGYTFLGYTDGKSSELLKTVTLTKNTTLYAAWEKPNSVVWDFSNGEKQGWNVENSTGSVSGGVLKAAFSTSNADLWFYNTGVNIDAATMRYVIVELKHNIPAGSTGSKPFEVFFTRTTDTPWQQHLSANIKQKAAGGFDTYIVDMKTCTNWNGTVNRLRIDPFEVKSPTEGAFAVEIKSIRVSGEAKLTLVDGESVQVKTVPAGVNIDLVDYAKPSESGRTFVGYAETPNGEILESIAINREKTLYAVWQTDKPTVSAGKTGVTAASASKATLAAAAYDADGRLKQTVFCEFTGSVEKTYAELGLDISDACTVKAYLLDESVSKVKPLCEAASVALKA